jgi:hypothetical protein
MLGSPPAGTPAVPRWGLSFLERGGRGAVGGPALGETARRSGPATSRGAGAIAATPREWGQPPSLAEPLRPGEPLYLPSSLDSARRGQA